MRVRTYAVWTNHQVEVLRRDFQTATREQLEQRLAPHSWSSIRAMGRKHGLKRSTYRNWKAICAAHTMKSGIFEVQG